MIRVTEGFCLVDGCNECRRIWRIGVQSQFSTKTLLFLFSGAHLFFGLRKGSAEPSMFRDQGKDFSFPRVRSSSIPQHQTRDDGARFPSTPTSAS